MLASLAKFSKSVAGKIMVGALMLGLASFGIVNVITGLGDTTVASVAGEDISSRDFQRAYDNQLNAFSRQMGRVPTSEEAVAFGIPGMVISQLATQEAVSKLGQDLGLGVSEQKLGQMLREDPSFSGTLGGFDRDNFVRTLAQMGYTENEYFELQTKAARRQQLASGLFGGSPVPQVAKDLIKRFSGDTRTVDYFVLNAESLASVPEPTESDLVAYLTENQAQYRTEETRTIDVISLSPEGIAATLTATDEEIAAEYERTKDSRVKIERRTIRQLPLATPELEALFVEGQAAGRPLADLLTESGASFVDLGTLSKAEITDSGLAEAAYSLPLDGYAVIDGIGSKRVITVSAIEAGGVVSLEESRDEISRQLRLAAARASYPELLDQIEELRAAFQPLTEIAARFNLPMKTAAVTASGAELSVVEDLPEEERARVAARIFSTQQGDLAPAVMLGSNFNLWFDIKAVDPVRDQTLAEVRDAVSAAWTQQKTNETVAAAVEGVMADLRAGTPFADVAVAANQFPQISQPLTRSGQAGDVLDDAVASAVFDGGATHFGSAENANGDRVVFQVVEVTPAAADAPDAARQFIEDGTRDSLYADFVAGLTAEAGLRTNQQLLNQILALDTTAQ